MTLALAPSGFMEAISDCFLITFSGWVFCHSVEYFITRKRTEMCKKKYFKYSFPFQLKQQQQQE
jgi:hypothetical protein